MPKCRCSFCDRWGHNKMGCPKAKAMANDKVFGDGNLSPIEQYDEYCKENETENAWLGAVGSEYSWDYRVQEAVEIQLEKRKRSRKVKRCRFCDLDGHNKRTCPEIKKTKQWIIDANNSYRAKLLEELKDLGVGLGGLIQPRSKWHKKGHARGLGIIKCINWQSISIFNRLDGSFHDSLSENILQIQWSSGLTEMIDVPIPLDKNVKALQPLWRSRAYTVISPSTRLEPDNGWLSSEDMLKNISESFSPRSVQSSTFNMWSDNAETLKEWSGYSIHGVEYEDR
jgi:hypothetical protein